MNHHEREELERWIDIITQKATDFGLDCYPTHFEVVPDHVIYELGSYSLPARFSHWTFGRDFHRQKTSYDYGMSKIYEIVFNSDPCQAFLVESASMLSHKFVVAHVLGHNDFFKNNQYFEHTDRGMIETVRLHGNRIRQYEEEFGFLVVEEFIDSVLAIEYNFDVTLTAPYKREEPVATEAPKKIYAPRTEYDDIWNIMQPERKPLPPKGVKFPESPEKDLLGFLRDYAPDLKRWQRDILSMIREEMIYFIPQMRTKTINEGWASFWHERILNELELSPEEHLEFRRLHSSVLSPGSKMSLNPYYVGYNLFRDIEKRWNGDDDADFPEDNWLGESVKRPVGEGMKKIFEVRKEDNDLSFQRKFLTQNMIKRLDMYSYAQEEVDGERAWVVQETDWRKVRDTLLDSTTNFGLPLIFVEDGDFNHRGELLLKHSYDGKSLDIEYVERTLSYLCKIWGRPVHLDSFLETLEVRHTHNGEYCEMCKLN